MITNSTNGGDKKNIMHIWRWMENISYWTPMASNVWYYIATCHEEYKSINNEAKCTNLD